MDITILGGINEIGGNKILLSKDNTNILLDFGMSFKRSGEYFADFLNPRKCTALKDFFEFNLLPDLDLYRKDYLGHMGRRAVDKSSVNAVFITHAHLDHAGYIHFIRHDIPIYCMAATHRILKSIEETGSIFSEFTHLIRTFQLRKGRSSTMVRMSKRDDESKLLRKFTFVDPPLNKIKVGAFEVTCLPVDHSLSGACGFIVKDNEKTLVYTGDIRFHGSNQELSKRFVEEAKKSKPDYLITEGTRVTDPDIHSESDVEKVISNIISETEGLVCLEFGHKDLDRAHSVLKASVKNDRKYVVTTKMAHLIQTLGDLSPFSIDDVSVLVPKKSWGLIGSDWEPKIIKQDYKKWERAWIDHPNMVTTNMIKDSPEKYVLSMNMWIINLLIDIQPKNATWIKSSVEPFNEGMELDEDRKKSWLKHFSIKEVITHASGHASRQELFDMVREINPKVVIPIHTNAENEYLDNSSEFNGIPVMIAKENQKII